MQKEIKAKHAMAALALLGLLGAVPGAQAVEWKDGETHNVGTGTTDENLSFQEQFTLSGGTVNFGSTNDKAGTITSSDKVIISGGTITVSGSGTKVSGALQMGVTSSNGVINPLVPQVKPGSTNNYLENPDPSLIPPVHSINAGSSMTIDRVDINIGAPRYTVAPSQPDIDKSWEGLRLDFKSAGDMTINGGDYRVANIAYPIKAGAKEDKAAMRFESGSTLTVNGGTFTAQGQPVGNPARPNYDSPSLFSMKAKDNLVIKDGTFVIESARFHMGSTEGKVIIDGGTFNINSKSPYPGWTTFDVVRDPVTGKNVGAIRDPAANTKDAKDKFGSLDTGGSLLEINGGTFNLGTPGETTPNYINMADKEAVFNGGTFNIYNGSNFGNNKAGTIINGGTYNLIDGGYFGGRNTNGSSVNITGGTFNMEGGQGMFGYSIGVITEAAYLNDDKYNKSTIDISGGTFNYNAKDNTKLEVSTVYAGYGINISGGTFIRKADGANSITVAFNATGQTGSAAATSGDLNISGGEFKTDNPILSYTENPKVDTNRTTAIKLKNPSGAGFNEALANGTQAEKDALAAGKASDSAQKEVAFDFTAKRNLTVSGGTFHLNGANLKKFSGETATFSGGTLNMSEGYTEIAGKNGIFFKGGAFNVNGTKEYAQYDLSRDRWVLGSRLTLLTDGNIIFGEAGTTGPVFNVKDSLLMATGSAGGTTKPGDFIFNSGNYNIEGTFRSTLLQAAAKMEINGGDFRVTSSDELYAKSLTGEEAKSMITMDSVTMKNGSMYLNNADLNGLNAINVSGGKLMAGGVSVINSNGAYGSKNVAGIGFMNISGGEFVREKDGLNGTQLKFNTNNDMNISGGVFRTAGKSDLLAGVVVSRDDNVRLYNKNDPKGTDAEGKAIFGLHTEDTIKAVFATNDQTQIKAAFAPKSKPDYVPTQAEVLKALTAALNIKASNALMGWSFEAERNINITGGTFDLGTVNASSFKAGGTFNFANAKLISSGGGGALAISGKDGINLISGSIASYGGDENGPFALQYDNRKRLDRDRWTLGKYMNFATDGDITIGAKGTAGPDIYYQDGMLGFGTVTKDAPLGNLYLYSGTLTLNGEYRATLNAGNMANSIIDGGTLRIRTADRLNRNELDSASMWVMPVTLKSGLIDLYNAQLGGPVVMDGGVINAMGDSSINASSSTKVQLNAGIVNMGSKAYIGAIKGDSLKLSPYVTGTKDIELGDKLTVNMDVSQPASGTALTVGKNIGGIYASANAKGVPTGGPTSITIADGTKFNITNPLALDAGTYTAASLVEAQNGTVTMKDRTFDSRFYGYTLNKASASSADMVLTVKNPVNVIAQLSGNSNIRDNAAGFSEILRNAKGNWLNVVDTVAHGSDGEAAEVLRQVGGENTTATTQSLVNSVGEYRTRMQSQGKSNISGLSGGDSMTVNGYRGWISAMGSWGSQADSDGRTGFDASSAGMALGFDTTFADRYTMGLGIGYAKGFSESKDSLSEANSDTWFVSLYTSLDFNPVVIDADVTYANTQSHINNTINAGGQRFENSGDFGIDSWSASIKGSYVFSFNDNATKIAPYVGIDFLSINQHGYSEEGPLAREFGSDQSSLWTLPVGIKASHQFRGQDWTFTPEIGVGYARDLNEFKPAAHVTIPGVSTTEIKSYGTEMSPDSFRGNAGFSVKYKDSVEFFGMYNLDARDKYTNHSVNVGFSYSF